MDLIRVFVADDRELVRYALRTLLGAEPDIEVVGEATDSESAVAGCRDTNPDVVVLDSRMRGDGVEACRAVRDACPQTAVLVLSSFDGTEGVFEALSAGACGYLLRDTRPEHIVHAIRAIADGEAVFDPSVVDCIIAGRTHGSGDLEDPLSDREMDVLDLMARGLSNKEIGRALWIGETTVKTHVSHILRKLDQADRTQAVLAAVRLGIVRLGH